MLLFALPPKVDAIVLVLCAKASSAHGPSRRSSHGRYQIAPAVDNMSHSREGAMDVSSLPIFGETMPEKTHPASEPDWLDPVNDRKTPYNRDVPAWRSLIAEVGKQEATAIAKQRLADRDPLSLIN